MTYNVVIFAKQTNEFLVSNSVMSGTGLLAVLKHMTDLNRDERNSFMRDLQNQGTSIYIPEDSVKLQYSVAAMEEKGS